LPTPLFSCALGVLLYFVFGLPFIFIIYFYSLVYSLVLFVCRIYLFSLLFSLLFCASVLHSNLGSYFWRKASSISVLVGCSNFAL